MDRSRLIVAIILAGLGALWIGQGLGFIGGSFMTGSLFWAGAGVVVLGLGLALGWTQLRRAR